MLSRHRYVPPVLLPLCALLGVLLALGVSGGAGASLVWNGDFDTGNLSQFSTTYCYQTYSCTAVSAPGGHSGTAGRFELGSGETSPIGNAHAQVQQNSSEHSGDESWWHWEVYLPADFKDSGSFWQVITEWHQYALSGSCNCSTPPPLTFQEINGRYVVRIVNSPDPAQSTTWTQYDLGAAARGGWTSFTMHAKWSDDPAVAVTDVYVNGTQVQHITGHPNEFTGYFNYFLGGWYRATDPLDQVIYLDNIRRATSFAEAEGSSSTTSASTTTTTSSSTSTASPVTATPTTTSATATTSTTPTTGLTSLSATTTNTTTAATTTAATTTTTTATAGGKSKDSSAATTTATTTTSSAPPPPAYTVSIISPSAGANLTGRVTWMAQTYGATTSEVDFFIDGMQKWTEYWWPYYFGGSSQSWDTTGVKNGNHTLMVRAISSTGLVTTSSITVTVNNPRKSLNKAS